MYEVLNRYLVQNKSISIPGLGSIVAETIPAINDIANKRLLPVQYKFRFDKYFDAPDREFFIYLSQKKNIADFEAIKLYSEFAYELRHKIRTDNEAIWEGIGTFKKDPGGHVIFEPFAHEYELYAPMKAERAIHEDVQHTILVGDKEKTSAEMAHLLNPENKLKSKIKEKTKGKIKETPTWLNKLTWAKKEPWKLYAMIIGGVALVGLLFHLLTHDIKWGIIGNQQNINAVAPAATH